MAAAAVTAWTDVTVRVYDAARLPQSDAQKALAIAASTLGAAGVEVTWRACVRDAPRGTDPCDAPIVRGELVLRILQSPESYVYSRRMPLGDAIVDTRAGQGILGTLYVDRVRWLADVVDVDASTLLGRAIAHELGHLLLATNEHSRHGLMRGVWSLDELRQQKGFDWLFAAQEVAAIHRKARALNSPIAVTASARP